MTPAPSRPLPSTGELITREVKRLQAQAMKDATPDVWAGVGDGVSFTASAPLVMGNPKAASQTYNAGALFTNNANAISKG